MKGDVNMDYPITAFREDILKAVKERQVVIITAETGAGKSTQVPQYLLSAGYNMVITQPRRVAARRLANRVAEETKTDLGHLVGFRISHERKDSEATRCLFATDGLALIRELMSTGKHDVLILDEVHEWNTNMEVLVALAKKRLIADVDFKLLIMSATIDANGLSKYFMDATIITVPNRQFPVETIQRGSSLNQDVKDLLNKGKNVLVFQPGKREIEATINWLKGQDDLTAEILPLHSYLSSKEQDLCFKGYDIPKCIVATNIAQTSITIPDIDAVVDSGLERRIETNAFATEDLIMGSTSLADCEQRKGRAGRTKPGIYIDWLELHNNVYSPSRKIYQRCEFSKAEIQRIPIDSIILRLKHFNIDVEQLEFFHKPSPGSIDAAKKRLTILGCLEKDGNITPIGCQVARLPVSARYGRMLVEAEKLGVVDETILMIAALTQMGIHNHICQYHERTSKKVCQCWTELVPKEKESDLLAQLTLYRIAENMTKDEMKKSGILPEAFYRAKWERKNLVKLLRGRIKRSRGNDRESLLRVIYAGMADTITVLPPERESILNKYPHLFTNGQVNCLKVGVLWDNHAASSSTGCHVKMGTILKVDLLKKYFSHLIVPVVTTHMTVQALNDETGARISQVIVPDKDLEESTNQYDLDDDLPF